MTGLNSNVGYKHTYLIIITHAPPHTMGQSDFESWVKDNFRSLFETLSTTQTLIVKILILNFFSIGCIYIFNGCNVYSCEFLSQ